MQPVFELVPGRRDDAKVRQPQWQLRTYSLGRSYLRSHVDRWREGRIDLGGGRLGRQNSEGSKMLVLTESREGRFESFKGPRARHVKQNSEFTRFEVGPRIGEAGISEPLTYLALRPLWRPYLTRSFRTNQC